MKVMKNHIYFRSVINITHISSWIICTHIHFLFFFQIEYLVFRLIVGCVIEFFFRKPRLTIAIPSITYDTLIFIFSRHLIFYRAYELISEVSESFQPIAYLFRESDLVEEMFVPPSSTGARRLRSCSIFFFFSSESLRNRGGGTGRIFSRGDFSRVSPM